MKKYVNIAVLLVSTLFVKAQCADKTVVTLTERSHYGQTGYYYKDANNVLNNFVGHYRYVNGNTTFEVKLQKKEGSTIPTFDYCEDMIIGGYKYIKNGQLVTDQLNNVNESYLYGNLHLIYGNLIYTGNEMGCTDCAPTEKWIVLSIKDVHSGDFGRMYTRKIMYNGQEALKVYMTSSIRVRRPGDPPLSPIMLPVTGEDMILLKL